MTGSKMRRALSPLYKQSGTDIETLHITALMNCMYWQWSSVVTSVAWVGAKSLPAVNA